MKEKIFKTTCFLFNSREADLLDKSMDDMPEEKALCHLMLSQIESWRQAMASGVDEIYTDRCNVNLKSGDSFQIGTKFEVFSKIMDEYIAAVNENPFA